MGSRLFPRTLSELFAYALALEREAAKRFGELARCLRDAGAEHLADEFERLAREEREQYELIALGTAGRILPEVESWEFCWHFMGPAVRPRRPRSTREAIAVALAGERRVEAFYATVAENARDGTVCAFAAEMAADERRHILRLEQLLERESEPLALEESGAAEPLVRS